MAAQRRNVEGLLEDLGNDMVKGAKLASAFESGTLVDNLPESAIKNAKDDAAALTVSKFLAGKSSQADGKDPEGKGGCGSSGQAAASSTPASPPSKKNEFWDAYTNVQDSKIKLLHTTDNLQMAMDALVNEM